MNKNNLFNKTVVFLSKADTLEATIMNKKSDKDVTSLQFELIKVLYFSSNKTFSSLSKCLHINLPNCSREVKKLTAMGYIEKRVSNHDKRQTELSLTQEGNKKVESFLSEMKDNFFKKHGNLTEEKIIKCIECFDYLQKEIFNY